MSNTAGTRVSDSAVTHVPNAAVTHVSDTARWVAAHRAVESERPDALFEDPLADRLAGARGRAIAATAESSMSDNWFLVTRTKLIDDQVTAAIDQGCEVIVNLGAGLDTRPYRLPLPADLTWIETDLPDLIAEKETLLTDETPRCRLIRTALDVTDIVAVATLLDTIADRRALVLTEGLLMYLPEPAVAALSTTLHRPKVQWCLDFSTAGVANLMTNRNEDLLQRAPWIFLPPNGIAYFETQGWQTEYLDSIFTAAITFDRLPFPNAREALTGPQPDPRAPGDWPYSAVARLTY
ncbi:class I SAM-dependent methyltransferase [Nocardia sp. NPDC004068]|uniref:class I SAM-dependent methyltransferase n=1 Tax=Nocardia sp. NPDC004068 TaxID=3364303 RepID=UPI0036D16415